MHSESDRCQFLETSPRSEDNGVQKNKLPVGIQKAL